MKLHFHLFALLLFCSAICNTVQAQATWNRFVNPGKATSVVQTDSHFWMSMDKGVMKVDRNTLAETWFKLEEIDAAIIHISEITLSPEGQPWIGTYDVALYRFTGSTWQNEALPADIETAMQDQLLYATKFDAQGKLWMATSNGFVTRSAAGVWNHTSNEDINALFPNNFSNQMWDFSFDNEGNTYISGNSFFKVDAAGEITNLTGDNFEGIFAYSSACISLDDDHIYYITDLAKVGFFTNGVLDSVSSLWDLGLSEVSTLYSIKVPGENTVLISQNENLYRWNNGVLGSYTSPLVQWLNKKVDLYFIDDSGQEWAILNDTLFTLQNGSAVQKKLGVELPSNDIAALAHLDSNTIIASFYPNGTNPNGGLAIYDYVSSTWASYNEVVVSGTAKFIRDSDNALYLHDNSLLYAYSAGVWAIHPAMATMPTGIALYETTVEGAHVWIAYNYVIYHWDGSVWEEFNSSNSALFTNGYLQEIEALPNGACLAVQYKPLYGGSGQYYMQKIDAANNVTSQTLLSLLGVEYVQELHYSAFGTIWAGGYSDYLGRKTDMGVWENLTASVAPLNSLFQIEEYAPNKLAIASLINGLLLFDYSNLSVEQFLPSNSGLADSILYAVHVDPRGSVWCGHNKNGISVYYPNGAPQVVGNQDVAFKTNPLTLSPNPATTAVTLTWQQLNAAASGMVHLFDASGKMVFSQSVGASQVGQNKLQLDILALPQGAYQLLLLVEGQKFNAQLLK